MPETIYHYFDYKSPYAYLAQADTYRLVSEQGLLVEWLPYTLDIPSYLGNAALDESGRDTVGTRNAHQWRRVKYSYMDCRREANRAGLVLRGPRKIFDSTLAHLGFLFAKQQGDFWPYHERVYRLFWRRELDIEDRGAMSKVIAEIGLRPSDFEAFCNEQGKALLSRIQSEAEELGVFGVPSYVIGDELFWGLERLPRALEWVQNS